MSVSIGGLVIMPLRNYLLGVLLGKVAFRSMFFVLLVLAVLLILAYLTNPSETSFRTYLTEQSFRQHLSRLDESNEDDHSRAVDLGPRHQSSARPSNSNDSISPFHFANRASISLRTPKHVFHSFGIFTIAAMVPLANPNGTSTARNIYRDGSMITDSWFIGAFGKWWRGGILEAWYHDIVARSKDEESWNSGILNIKSLDKFSDFQNGLPFTSKNTLSSAPTRISPPRLKNRERPSQRLGALPIRSSTPPPPPKSASLPIHATRSPNPALDHRHAQVASQTTVSLPSEHTRLETPALSRSSSTLFDQSPMIAEVLRQITASNSAVHDLREQLADFQSTASQSHAILQSEVDSYRDRKRQEDASRVELKSRTKTLEDSKRSAESTKLKAERKLKAAQTARSDTSRRIEFLDQQVTELRKALVDGEASALQSKDDASKSEQNLLTDIERKKQEIKDAEELVVTLNARARELEEKLASQREMLQLARERAEIRKQDQSFFALYIDPERTSNSPISVHHRDAPFVDHPDAFASSDHNISGRNREHSVSPQLTKLSVGTISNFNGSPSDNIRLGLRAKGYSIFDDDIASLTQSHPGTVFAPFSDNLNGLDHVSKPDTLQIPVTSPLVPSGVMGSVNGVDQLARTYQMDNDPFSDMDRRGVLLLPQTSNISPLTTSPVSVHDSSKEYDPFEVRLPPLPSSRPLPTPPTPPTAQHHRPSLIDAQQFTMLHRANSDPARAHESHSSSGSVDSVDLSKVVGAPPRRWFSARVSERPRKGLNPDAKVFSLSRSTLSPINGPLPRGGTTNHGSNGHIHGASTTIPYDALNPNGVSTSSNVSTTTTSAFLHAFAPSPAEREALQRALGGGSNASLERLPSLSDVGSISIPSSPARVSAQLQLPSSSSSSSTNAGLASGPDVAGGRSLPSWLQALPRIRKPNFSPWDDDEVLVDVANRKR